ncbi:hypothetical protein F4679DRAFT_600315 [Xylaria curta]|nr:hypothetical protein F4679DRAFT_600315 [Xylaria curta]
MVIDFRYRELVAFTETEIRRLNDRLTSITKAEENMFADRIVASLNYSNRPVRHNSVPKAHRNTFQWAFGSRLSKWLSSRTGTFWISGKPGSGKSTFMKFIARHSQTKDLLTRWAASADSLALACQGLLQSLLFDVCHKHPSVVPLISPKLAVALRELASADNVPLKICFFIDGLDEYDGDHVELCKVLCDIGNSPHIKMCVSSRPYAVFEESFGGEGKERMDIHELTRNDIREFVNGSGMALSERFRLLGQVVAKAGGVFLWAFFVAQLLREGLSNGDRIGDLSQRLSGLPTDLEQLCKNMLESAAAHALEPLHVDLFWELERGFEDHDYVNQCPIRYISPEQVVRQREQTERSIKEKTKGLLKLVDLRIEFLHRTVRDFVLTKHMEEHLRSKLPDDYNGFISIATAYLGFLGATRYDNSLVAGIMRHGKGLNSGPFISHLNQALIYAAEALKVDHCSPHHYQRVMALPDRFEVTVEVMVRVKQVTVRGVNSEDCLPGLPFREELLRRDVASYVRKKIRERPDFFDVFDESSLFAALTPMVLNSSESPAPENPNVLLRARAPGLSEAASPWVIFARSTMSVFNTGPAGTMVPGPLMFPALRWNVSLNDAFFDLLQSHGADPNKALLDRPEAHTVFSLFLTISSSQFLGEECFDGYLRTLDAFLRAGASLGVPQRRNFDPSAEAAHGNLARPRPEEPVLASYCTGLKDLTAKLAADPRRARFLSSVTEKLIMYCSKREEDLKRLSSAISESFPKQIAKPLLRLIDNELEMGRRLGGTRKRQRESLGDRLYSAGVKHIRRK